MFEEFTAGKKRLVFSDLVLFELEGAPENVSEILNRVPEDGIEYVFLNEESISLANSYLKEGGIAENSLSDARHIAIATVERVDVLVSWNFKHMRLFYLTYPYLLAGENRHAVSDQSHGAIPQAKIRHAVSDESVIPGVLNPNLSWTHYRLLTKVESERARSFYEIEAARNRWSSRELERQINSLLYERLAKSRDKKGALALARRGQEIHNPNDAIKDPVVLEFLSLPETPRLVESKLEEALLNHLQQLAAVLADNRQLIITPFSPSATRITQETANKRNQLMAELANEIFVAYAQPGGNVEHLVMKWLKKGKKVSAFDVPENRRLLEAEVMGV